jgi:hypothetical protein
MKTILNSASCLGLAILMVNLLSPEVVAQDAVIEEISVTGSRIRGANPDSFSPVAVITLEDIQISGAISIGELLQQLPSQGSGLNRNYNNGGSGAVRMDLETLVPAEPLFSLMESAGLIAVREQMLLSISTRSLLQLSRGSRS